MESTGIALTSWIFPTVASALVFDKGNRSLLFEGRKIWQGNIWVLVLLSHLFAPYLVGLLIYRSA